MLFRENNKQVNICVNNPRLYIFYSLAQDPKLVPHMYRH